MPVVVKDVGPNDVLLGRGNFTVTNQGNVRFRQLICSRMDEYKSSNSRWIKQSIAREVLEEIFRRQGRFLMKINTLEDKATLGVPDGECAWTVVSNNALLEKVKQALRQGHLFLSASPIGSAKRKIRRFNHDSAPTLAVFGGDAVAERPVGNFYLPVPNERITTSLHASSNLGVARVFRSEPGFDDTVGHYTGTTSLLRLLQLQEDRRRQHALQSLSGALPLLNGGSINHSWTQSPLGSLAEYTAQTLREQSIPQTNYGTRY